MSVLAHLKAIVEKKSGAPMLVCNVADLHSYLGFDPAAMRRDGFDPSTIEIHEQFYERLESFMEHPVIGEYLTTLTPTRQYHASGLGIATLLDIQKSTFGDGSPDSELFQPGYIPIGGDVGGNSVSFHAPSGRVVFAHHELTDDIIAGKIQVLSEDIAAFLDDLIHDR